MKKIFKYAAIAYTGLLAMGCSNEESVVAPANEETVVRFSINIDSMQANEPVTRSLASGYHFSDGRSISVVKCYVYNQASASNAAPIKTMDISISNLKGDVEIPLPKNEVFDVVFLATSIPQNSSGSKLYYNTTERSLNVNYGIVNCNDEELDCFFATKAGVSSNSAGSINVELKRPFAQLNLGGKDYSAYDAANAIKSVSVGVKGIYNKVDLMSGNVVGDPTDVTFGASLMPAGQTFPKSGTQYIAMNYLLVDERKLVEVELTLNHHNTTISPLKMNFKNIAVERNFQTNVTIPSLIN